MKRAIVSLLVAMTSALSMNGAMSEDTGNVREDSWLMMVTTNATDPEKDREFNMWYDEIDIPDVLEVPGYMRARRGLIETVAELSQAQAGVRSAKYVALYDIRTGSIDKIIIDMLMASRKMVERGRSTDLLEVVERVYYRQYSPMREREGAATVNGDTAFLYLTRIECCLDEASNRHFDAWYDDVYLPALLLADGVRRATRYELYRVLMVDPPPVPNYLTVVEIAADSAANAARSVRAAISALRDSGRMSPMYVEAKVDLYRKIGDVRR